VRNAYPKADFLIPTYRNPWISNSRPSDMTNVIELSIRERYNEHKYSKIILLGYSLGGLLLRKAYVWGSGFESDRVPAHGRHEWASKVDRFVSLAAPNRGWPTHQTENMRADQYILGYIACIFGRLTGTGQVVVEILQGSPFVANLRLQWISLFRSFKADASLPLIVHLIGGKDELVDRKDSIDIEAAAQDNVIIKTFDTFKHGDIATRIYDKQHRPTQLGASIVMALTKTRDEFPEGWADKSGSLQVDENVTQIVFVMHGIRDESNWPSDIKQAIEEKLGDQAATVKIVAPLYRRFALLPFLLYWDRQEHVRWFMDEYTEAKAKYPYAKAVDFVGHSNGTYILASALQKYSELEVRNVFFAGSVLPMQYDWKSAIGDHRLTGEVWNVCADLDWVVAIFPQLFQQISDFLKINPSEPGLLDIGSAGFRGFRAGVGTNKVHDVKSIIGYHGAAFDSTNTKRLDAVVDFLISGASAEIVALKEIDGPSNRLEFLSTLSWLIWIIGVRLIVWIAIVAYGLGTWWFICYMLFVLGILITV
jgi:pimeloyl-ACP methyl ester carboxylesterase